MTNPQALPPAAQAAVERAEKATSGPWQAKEPRNTRVGVYAGETLIAVIGEAGEDADFIAHAREDIPMLAALLTEVLSQVKRQKESGASVSGLLIEAVETGDGVIGELERQLATEQAAERHRYGGHVSQGFAENWRACLALVCQEAQTILADLPAAGEQAEVLREIKSIYESYECDRFTAHRAMGEVGAALREMEGEP